MQGDIINVIAHAKLYVTKLCYPQHNIVIVRGLSWSRLQQCNITLLNCANPDFSQFVWRVRAW